MFLQVSFRFLLLIFACINLNHPVNAQVSTQEFEELKGKVEQLENENSSLRSRLNTETANLKNEVKGYAPMAMVVFLFGGFCALWAQNTGRNPWSWFFLGLIFSVLTVLIVLMTNANDIKRQ